MQINPCRSIRHCVLFNRRACYTVTEKSECNVKQELYFQNLPACLLAFGMVYILSVEFCNSTMVLTRNSVFTKKFFS